jgi:hypothetical protein
MHAAAEEGTIEFAELVVEKARANTPPSPENDPHPEWTLQDAFEIHADGPIVMIENNLPYAVKQHEALHFQHPNGGRAKFLEKAVWDSIAAWEPLLAAAVRTVETGARARGNRTRQRQLTFRRVAGYTTRHGKRVRPYVRHPGRPRKG